MRTTVGSRGTGGIAVYVGLGVTVGSRPATLRVVEQARQKIKNATRLRQPPENNRAALPGRPE